MVLRSLHLTSNTKVTAGPSSDLAADGPQLAPDPADTTVYMTSDKRDRRLTPTQQVLLVATAVAAAVGLVAAIFGASLIVVIANVTAVACAITAWILPVPADEGVDLIAEVSHELRTPLTGILGTLELLTDSTIPLETSEVDELLVSAHSEANHLLHVVGNLHAHSRLDRELLSPDLAPVNLRSIIGKAVARSPRVAGRCYLSPGDQAVAIGDPQLLMQIATNLIQNIERYAPEGDVRVHFSRTGDTMKATFVDSGPGVDAKDAEHIFDSGPSTTGLGLGLSLSTQLAGVMGGQLTLDNPGEQGASFTLSLPASNEVVPADKDVEVIPGDRARAHSPRARLLVDLAEALAGESLDNVVGGINKIYRELLNSTGAMLLLPRKDGSFHSAGPYSDEATIPDGGSRLLEQALVTGETVAVDDITKTTWGSEETLGGRAAMLLPVHDAGRTVAILAVGWKSESLLPTGPAVSVAEALAELTASAIARTALARDVVYERTLRASVMNELPIAVSVFTGDPPQVIDWNRKEREMLGIDDDSLRPHDLAASQALFDVRFADGTPLTVDNAPVTNAVRAGKAMGPFILIVRRADGSEVHTRTYCAPFRDADQNVIGAVVTSEPMDLAVSPVF